MSLISAAVGPGAPNKEKDVRTIQELLGRHTLWLWPARTPVVSGQFDADTAAAIRKFQETAAAMKHPDGKVSPAGFTITQLERQSIPPPAHKVFTPLCWARDGKGLSVNDFDLAARQLGCQRAAIQAVAQTETKRSPWDDVGRPTILFERHYFSRLSGRRFDRSHPDISNPTAGGYGKFSEQYEKLRRAAILNESAALQSASWGAFQIMGANYAASGFADVAAFVDAMLESEQKHLNAFVAFIQASPALTKAIKDLDWVKFARGYNGPDYKKNDYDTKMADAYKALAPPAPAPAPAPRPKTPAR
ncbi:N-acetylmuramidase domain-containing protein [Caulobacter sp. LARHSG274]